VITIMPEQLPWKWYTPIKGAEDSASGPLPPHVATSSIESFSKRRTAGAAHIPKARHAAYLKDSVIKRCRAHDRRRRDASSIFGNIGFIIFGGGGGGFRTKTWLISFRYFEVRFKKTSLFRTYFEKFRSTSLDFLSEILNLHKHRGTEPQLQPAHAQHPHPLPLQAQSSPS
jgi:hypothetical protein